jgi:hypothetical protein
MAHGQDWMPTTIQGRIDMGRRWVDILKVKGTGWRVPEIVTGDLEEFVEAAEEAQAQALSAGANAAIRHRRDRFVAEMVAYMRDVRNRYFFIPPMNEEDFLSLGLRLPDTIRTQHTNVTEEVDFVLEIRGTKQVHVRFWVMGQANTAKPAGYDGAVIVWGMPDAPPDNADELPFHTMASRTPHTLKFDETDRGKTVYIALQWQNERGITGAWSDIKSTVIP